MPNRTILRWINPVENTDGTPYDHRTEGAGYELALNSETPTAVLPFAYGTEFDMKDLTAYQELRSGNHTVRLRVVNRDQLTSEWASQSFRKAGTPLAISNLEVV
jgi:hypothetical protein